MVSHHPAEMSPQEPDLNLKDFRHSRRSAGSVIRGKAVRAVADNDALNGYPILPQLLLKQFSLSKRDGGVFLAVEDQERCHAGADVGNRRGFAANRRMFLWRAAKQLPHTTVQRLVVVDFRKPSRQIDRRTTEDNGTDGTRLPAFRFQGGSERGEMSAGRAAVQCHLVRHDLQLRCSGAQPVQRRADVVATRGERRFGDRTVPQEDDHEAGIEVRHQVNRIRGGFHPAVEPTAAGDKPDNRFESIREVPPAEMVQGQIAIASLAAYHVLFMNDIYGAPPCVAPRLAALVQTVSGGTLPFRAIRG